MLQKKSRIPFHLVFLFCALPDSLATIKLIVLQGIKEDVVKFLQETFLLPISWALLCHVGHERSRGERVGKALPEPNTSLGWETSLSCLGEHPEIGRKGMGEESMWRASGLLTALMAPGELHKSWDPN